MASIEAFIPSYTAADESLIRFDWNGKHAEDFVDRNMGFRQQVLEKVLSSVASAPLPLVCALFRAETQFAEQAWGISDGIGLLAEDLLRRGGIQYLDDYLIGKYQCFDASMGTVFQVDLPLAQTMLDEVRRRQRQFPASSMFQLWQAGEELFAEWVLSCQQRTA